MSNLFKEALADSQALKKVAEENAIKAIVENVKPQIREFIENSLLEGDDTEEEKSEEESSEEEEKNESVYLDESSLQSLVDLLGENVLDSLTESKSKKALSSAITEAAASLDDKDREKLFSLSQKISKSADNLMEDKSKGDKMSKYLDMDLKTLKEAVEAELREMDDLHEYEDANEGSDLYEEISSLLEQEEDEDDEDVEVDMPDFGEEDEAPDLDLEDDLDADAGSLSKDAVSNALADAFKDVAAELGLGDLDLDEDEADVEADLDFEAEDEEMQADEEADEEVDEEVLAEALRRIKRMMKEAKGDDSFGGKGSANAGVGGSFGGKGKQKAGVDGSFGGGKSHGDAFQSPPSSLQKLNEELKQLRRINRAQTEKLNKYRGAVDSLREQLEKLNLFSAKLLFVNKLMQNKNINESQQRSIIKVLDEAETLQEAKSLYTTLTDTLGKSNAKARKTLSESVSGSSARPTTSSQTSTGSQFELNRWERLAGLGYKK